MSDIPADVHSVPWRLGVSAAMRDGRLELVMDPYPSLLHHGVVRMSALSFLVDVVAGIVVDTDPDQWLLTTDMTIRSVATPPTGPLIASTDVLRLGRRSSVSDVEITSGGRTQAIGAIGFARVPRRPTDPPKPAVNPEDAVELFDDSVRLDGPLREEARIEVLDAAAGIVQVQVTPAVRNPAGTLHGAMVALVAEAAVEDLLEARWGRPVAVVDMDLRYLRTAHDGPVRSSCRWIGTEPEGSVEVRLTDMSTGELTTLVHTRAVAILPE